MYYALCESNRKKINMIRSLVAKHIPSGDLQSREKPAARKSKAASWPHVCLDLARELSAFYSESFDTGL